jgi:crotonobetainyl-CoA:carnitine CoA-transferase CaiB-like acyl-CoA transferase
VTGDDVSEPAVSPSAPDAASRPTRPFAAQDELPLRGVTVLDLSRYLAGPYAATILGDLGADVIKVEALDRDDPAMHTAPMVGNDSLYYLSTVRNKRSIALNLKSREGYELLRRLCAQADIVVENYRRDVPASLGLEFEDFKAMNQAIVLCSVRSFPKESSVADSPAYDSAVQAYTGLMSVTGQADGPVARMGVAVADLGTGLYSCIGILAALHKAKTTGVGTHVELALSDTGIALMALQLATYLNTGQVIHRSGTEHPSMAPLRVFRTATKDILLMAAKNEEFERLATVLGVPELLQDDRFLTNSDRVKHQGELHALIEVPVAKRAAEEWLPIFERHRVACTLVRSVDDIAADDDFARTMLSRHEHPGLGELRLVRNPLTLDGGSPPLRSTAPYWGEQTQEILEEIGIPADEVARLRAQGVVR